MGGYRLGLAVVAATCILLPLKFVPAQAQGALATARLGTAIAPSLVPLQHPVLHRKRARSFYCYPRNYWWFYRPYTTAKYDYARCMPYFHYLGPSYGRRGGKSGYYRK